MNFSLIVATTDRFSFIDRLFNSLTSQRYKKFEIIFVCGEPYSAEAKNLVGKYNEKLNIKIFTDSSHSASAKRNIALNTASGDIIAFPDDDCLYFPDTLQIVHDILSSRPEVHALLGTRTGLNGDWHQERQSDHLEAKQITTRYDAFRNSETFLQFYRKHCIESIGLFDETLGPGTGLPYGSGEDTDYVLRAFSAGFNIFRSPDVIVAHPDIPLGNQDLYPKAASYAAGRMRLLQKHSMPLWFELANIMYPLCRIPLDCFPVLRYRWMIFQSRLVASIQNRIRKRKS
jgi:GT2 family glycosyltransferase